MAAADRQAEILMSEELQNTLEYIIYFREPARIDLRMGDVEA